MPSCAPPPRSGTLEGVLTTDRDAVVQIENHVYDLRMVERTLEPALREVAAQMPVVAVTGPRQSGKTTLCRSCFPDYDYVTLEPLDVRDFATSDPRGFLAEHPGPAILDEVQRAPDLFSYLQGAVDEDPAPGRYILTGSQHFGLTESITQSLAGRIALLHLLPMSLEELRRFPSPPEELWATLWSGGYPRIHDRALDPGRWLADYVATYVQRDVRQVLNVADLDAFSTFLALIAGRTSRELHLASLGGDAGVSHPTVRSWTSVLETSFVVFKTPRWVRNVRKRTVKAPKVHFVDCGLACHLLGIRSPDQLRTHPLRGALFETWVAAEVLKARLHRRRSADLYHLRETSGIEVDLVVDAEHTVIAVEVKSGATVASDFFEGLRAFGQRMGGADPKTVSLRLVYGGDTGHSRSDVRVVPWHGIQDHAWV